MGVMRYSTRVSRRGRISLGPMGLLLLGPFVLGWILIRLYVKILLWVCVLAIPWVVRYIWRRTHR